LIIIDMADPHHPLTRPAAVDQKYVPIFVLAPDEGIYGYPQCIWLVPQYDCRIHLIAVAKSRRTASRDGIEADDHIDALFLNAQRRNLQVSHWLHTLDGTGEGLGATPLRDQGSIAWTYLHGLAGEKIDDQLDLGGVADCDEVRALKYHTLALVRYDQHCTGDGRAHPDNLSGGYSAGLGEQSIDPRNFRAPLSKPRALGSDTCSHNLQLHLRNETVLCKRFGTRHIALGLCEGCYRALYRRLGGDQRISQFFFRALV
jgi:hypothetical protein